MKFIGKFASGYEYIIEVKSSDDAYNVFTMYAENTMDELISICKYKLSEEMVKLSSLEFTIQNSIKEFYKQNAPHTLTKRQALYAYLYWQGIIGYTSQIFSIMEGSNEV